MKYIMGYACFLVLTMAMAGCDKETKDITARYNLPVGMEDCVISELTNDEGRWIIVTRCPNSTTSTKYKAGKAQRTTIVVDGVTYVKEEK